jgi:hypothetical protein
MIQRWFDASGRPLEIYMRQTRWEPIGERKGAMSEIVEPKNRRKTPRFAVECPVVFQRFNSNENYQAVTKNYSQDGMYIESNHHFRPGSQILIRRESCTEPFDCALCNTLQSLVLAEVKWIRQLDETDRPSYGFGVMYTL